MKDLLIYATYFDGAFVDKHARECLDDDSSLLPTLFPQECN